MTIHATRVPTTTRVAADEVLEVAAEDQEAYSRHSYHDYMRAWNVQVGELSKARRAGELAAAERLVEEQRHVWPRAGVVAGVAWVSDSERELALPPDQDR